MNLLRHLLVIVPLWVLFGFETPAYPNGILAINVTQQPISVVAKSIQTWQMEGVRAFSASGNVRITQGKLQISSDVAICWFYELEAATKPTARMEVLSQGDVVIIQGRDYEKYEEVYLNLETAAGMTFDTYSGSAISTLSEDPLADNQRKLKKIKELGLNEFAYKEPLELVLGEGPFPAAPDMVDITANDIDSWLDGDTRVVVAAGDVEIKHGEQKLTADNVMLWFDQRGDGGKKIEGLKEFYAEGNVTIVLGEKEDEIRRADKVFESFRDLKGLYVNPRIKKKIENFPLPAFVGGKEMKQIDLNTFEMKDGYFTTCSFGHPHYHVGSPKVIIRRRKTDEGTSYVEATAYDSVFYVGGVPTGYLPKYEYSTLEKKQILQDYSIGNSSRFGTFLQTDWNPYGVPIFPESWSEWSNMNVSLDYLNKRGPAAGFNFEYERSGEAIDKILARGGEIRDAGILGFLRTYYVNDKLERDESPGREPIKNKNRGWILARHRQQLAKELRVDAELSYLSDRNFLREYFEQVFFEGKKQETYLNLRWLRDNKGATFLVKDEINRWKTGLEERPRVASHVIGQPLWDNRLNLTSEINVGYLNEQLGEDLQERDKSKYDRLKATTSNAARFSADNTISVPFHWWIFKASPFVGGRATIYSKSINSSGPDGGATGRFIGSFGIDASTQMWKVYSYENKFLRINGLRHIMTPEFRWRRASLVTERPEDLLQFERADGLYKYNSAIFAIRNRLQTRRGPPWKQETVDLLEFGLEAHFFKKPNVKSADITRTMMTAEGLIEPRRDNFLQYDIRAQITNRLAVQSTENEFNLNERRLDVFNVGVNFQRSQDWNYFAGYRFIKDTTSTVTIGANLLLGKTWRATFSEGFDLGFKNKETGVETSKNLFSNFTFTKEYHDWSAGFNVTFDVANRNNAFSFVLSPKGVQQTFGRSYSYAGR